MSGQWSRSMIGSSTTVMGEGTHYLLRLQNVRLDQVLSRDTEHLNRTRRCSEESEQKLYAFVFHDYNQKSRPNSYCTLLSVGSWVTVKDLLRSSSLDWQDVMKGRDRDCEQVRTRVLGRVSSTAWCIDIGSRRRVDPVEGWETLIQPPCVEEVSTVLTIPTGFSTVEDCTVWLPSSEWVILKCNMTEFSDTNFTRSHIRCTSRVSYRSTLPTFRYTRSNSTIRTTERGKPFLLCNWWPSLLHRNIQVRGSPPVTSVTFENESGSENQRVPVPIGSFVSDISEIQHSFCCKNTTPRISDRGKFVVVIL